MEKYLKNNMLFRDYKTSNDDGIKFTGEILDLDLSKV